MCVYFERIVNFQWCRNHTWSRNFSSSPHLTLYCVLIPLKIIFHFRSKILFQRNGAAFGGLLPTTVATIITSVTTATTTILTKKSAAWLGIDIEKYIVYYKRILNQRKHNFILQYQNILAYYIYVLYCIVLYRV